MTKKNNIYCRKLEDGSGFVVVEASRGKWEKVLGLGSTQSEAWADYRSLKNSCRYKGK